MFVVDNFTVLFQVFFTVVAMVVSFTGVVLAFVS